MQKELILQVYVLNPFFNLENLFFLTSKDVLQKDFDRSKPFPFCLLTENRFFEDKVAATVRQGRDEGDHGRDVKVQGPGHLQT